jgi:hypothetical protein
MSNKILDVGSLDKLAVLARVARENCLAISLDYIGQSSVWIAQIFDDKERVVVTANGKTAVDAIQALHGNWFAKGALGE